MVVAETKDRHDFEEEVAPLYAFFPPFFFVFIGLEVDLGAFADAGTLGLLRGDHRARVRDEVRRRLARGAVDGRARGASSSGSGMVPRGEVGIIVAGIGATAGVIEPDLFAVIVGMSIATTLLIPPLLRRALVARRRRPDYAPPAVVRGGRRRSRQSSATSTTIATRSRTETSMAVPE